ncbi:MAG: FAD-dependent oxidoreductase [Victivallaceae bacterium]|nr:FAD-dependent oxidoreductase [Victivallaceae bacterium]
MYSRLFTPVKVGKLTLKNRFVMPAMLTNCAEPDGTPADRYIRYFEERAKGGFALLITGDAAVLADARSGERCEGLWEDRQIPGHRKLTAQVHKYGAAIFLQLFHPGRQGTLIAPSPMPDPAVRRLPRELSRDEIVTIRRAFIAASVRARECGYDGVELHCAHGYLLNEFLSNFSNRRTDEYGGTLTNRVRLVQEIVRGIRKTLGSDFVIACKLGCDEFVDGGIESPEAGRIAGMLAKVGVDMFTASGGVYKTAHRISASYYLPEGCFVPFAEKLREYVNVPICAVNRIVSPEVACDIVKHGRADLVAMGRAALADPALPAKLAKGNPDEVIPCISCDQGCIGEVLAGRFCGCLVNPRTGRECEFARGKTKKPRSVAVAGGGPAGLSFALTAAIRGHRVTLFEAAPKLGGFWLQAAVPPCKAGFNHLLQWYAVMLEKYRVEVCLETEFTPGKWTPGRFDYLAVACGGEPVRPVLPGLEKHPNVVFAVDLLAGKCAYGERVAVIGGGMVGLETAEHLAVHNSEVAVIARNGMGKGLVPQVAAVLFDNLRRELVALHAKCDVKKITDRSVTIYSRDTRKTIEIEADQIVLACGVASRGALLEWAGSQGISCCAVGDASSPGDGFRAIREGFDAAYAL